MKKGFAILLSLLLVLIFTVFAYWMLLIAQSHYAASQSLFRSDDARRTLDAVIHDLVTRHNIIEPGFFFEPSSWDQLNLKTFRWNEYSISGQLTQPWNHASTNVLILHSQKGRHHAEVELPLRNIRLEDFALISDAPQSFPSSGLFDGLVFVRSRLTLMKAARFQNFVYNEVVPEALASYKKKTAVWPNFIAPKNLLASGWSTGGFEVTGRNPAFWIDDHYELNLDQLAISTAGEKWEIRYKGAPFATTSELILIFDEDLHIRQTYRELPHLPSGKPDESFYIGSAKNIVLNTSVQTLENANREHSIALVSGESIRIQPAQAATRIQACLVSQGETSLEISGGAAPLNQQEKNAWTSEIFGSSFLLNAPFQQSLLEALDAGEKVVWFRGSVAVQGEIRTASDITQIHFEACKKTHTRLQSFPFLRILEGEKKWH